MDAFTTETAFTHRVLDSVETRAKVAMHNIANQNTPGFKRYTVRFAELLEEAEQTGRDPSTVHAVVDRDRSGPPDANNVDLMREFRELDEVRFLQQVFLMRSSGYFNNIAKAIKGQS